MGQILVGIEGDWIGRKFGLVQDALVMTRQSFLVSNHFQNTDILNSWSCHADFLLGYQS